MSYNLRSGVEYATVTRTGAGSVEVAAGVAGEKIVVLAAWGITTPGASGISSLQSETGPVIICQFAIANLVTDTTPINMPYSPVGWCETADGDDLDLVVATAGVCILNVAFIREPA